MATARTRPLRLFLLSLCLALAAVACSSTSWPVHGPVDAALVEARYPDADRVLLDATRTVRYHVHDGEPVTEVTTYERALILDPGDHGQHTLTEVHNRTFDEVLEMSARLTRPNGDVREFDLGDSDDLIQYSISLYSDVRRRELTVDGLVPGAILESRVVTRSRDVRMVAGRYSFGGRYPIVHEEFVVELPDGWRVDVYINDADDVLGGVPETERDGPVQRLRWAVDDQDAVEYEPRSNGGRPTVRTRLASWTIGGRTESGFADASELSAAEHALVGDAYVPAEPLDDRVAAILGDVDMSDPRRVVAQLHAWVRQNISYCSIPVGYGGWIPHPVDQILDVGYGDCKDKSTTLKALLDTVGIESHLAAVSSHDGFPIPFTVPVFGANFNHMILRVTLGDDEFYTDPTATRVPFGELPTSLYGAPVLPITEQGDDLQTIEVPPATDNVRRVVGRLTLAVGAPAQADLEFTLTGAWTHRLWGALDGASESEKLRAVSNLLELSSIELDDVSISVESSPVLPEDIAVEARGAAALVVLHEDVPRTLAARDLLAAAWPHLQVDDERRSAFYLGDPSVLEHELHLALPPGWRVTELPPGAAGTIDEASYQLDWERRDDGLVLRSRFQLDDPIVPASRYERVRTFLDEAIAAQTATFVIARDRREAAR